MKKETLLKIADGLIKFRNDLMQVLAEHGMEIDHFSTEEEIVEAFRKLLCK